MKKILNLIVWISSLSILLLSCSKDETENDKKPNEDDNNMVTVSLGMTGDILEVEETPLSRAAETADIYGIQIYSSPKDEDNYQPYGYGLFIDKSKMQVKLFKDRKYKFEMTVFPDGKYEVRENGEVAAITGLRPPFDDWRIGDSIIYGNLLGDLNSSYVGYNGVESGGEHRPIDRYYGKLLDYTPTDNGNVNIDLKRVVAGLTFKVKGLTNQSALKIEIEEAPTIEIKGDGTTDEATYNGLMCLKGETIREGDYCRYTDKWFENPIDEVPFKFTWTNGERTESFTQTVTLKRKMNYTFNITIPETFLVSNGITVTEEDKTWDEKVTVDNIYFGNLTIENEKDLQAFNKANYTKVTGNLIFKYWNRNTYSGDNRNLKFVGGDMKFIANSECLFNDYTFDFWDIDIQGNLELIATVPRCFCNIYNFNRTISKIGGSLRLIGTEASFEHLNGIAFGIPTEIGGSIEIITDNSNSFQEFTSLGFYEQTKLGGDIKLTNLSALRDYCDLKTVLQNHTGQFIVSGNAYNPTKEQILAGECSMQ